jgi:hypothetical protein
MLAAAAALASVIALSGCTGHAAGAHTAAPTAQPRTLADGMRAGVELPGHVAGTDGQGEVLVRLSSTDSTPVQLRDGSGGYALFGTSGKQLSWAAPSPVADAYGVHLTTAGLFVERAGAGDLSRVDPRTGAVLWSFNEAPSGTGSGDGDGYDYDSSGGELVMFEHVFPDPSGHGYDHELTALDARTGTTRFAIPSAEPTDYADLHPDLPQTQIISFSPLITATTASGADSTDLAYSDAASRDPQTGAITTKLDPSWFGTPRSQTLSPLATTGTAFVTAVPDGAKKSKVIARDATGKTVWTRVVDAVDASVSAADAGHVIVSASDDGSVFVLSAASGKPEGGYAPGGGSTLSASRTELVASNLFTVTAGPGGGTYLARLPKETK